jgi:hypothetical protein
MPQFIHLAPFAVIIKKMKRRTRVIGIPGFVKCNVGSGPESCMRTRYEPEALFVEMGSVKVFNLRYPGGFMIKSHTSINSECNVFGIACIFCSVLRKDMQATGKKTGKQEYFSWHHLLLNKNTFLSG